MGDATLWVAALTAATAVLASWVTSHGTARAARIQADAAAATVQADRLRAARRSAYVDVIEQAQRMGDLYWKVTDAHGIDDADERLAALLDLRVRLRGEYAVLRQRVWVADLEGPPAVAAAADRLRRSTSEHYRALDAMITGDTDAGQRFADCFAPFWESVVSFVDVARTALHSARL
ncbi:hypothetical protein [Streptomyces fructofermentans]|uniref:Uncharacterized protein n=1 Tax=Streptomyces fructofermentans TaxID=152141 RepID=A0A918KAP2_9ACTN|nr:hypothetical protein [Streptomyces fructofermentans]GGX56841.1 hypothetical protein GCM10010515_25420 [Streptomyces fructofermentans]